MSGELAHTAFQPAMGMQCRDGNAEGMGASTGKTMWAPDGVIAGDGAQ